MNSNTVNRIESEILEFCNNPAASYTAGITSSLFEWTANILGPPGSPYEGGVFFLDIRLPDNYPYECPKVLFRTRIYHCNINCRGEIYSSLLNGNWTSDLSVSDILSEIHDMLVHPNLGMFKGSH
mmetsp:Transcript_15191/g.19260  ORF Transcript_15191/g.19260 Transcript_15191/m.19260 type:complete len:125 (+) Transcript_15191:1-375(+)